MYHGTPLGAIQLLRNAFFLESGPPPPAHYANNVEPYTLFPGKFDTPHPHLHYVTLGWPLSVCVEAVCCSSKFQREMVFGKKLHFIVFVLQLYGI